MKSEDSITSTNQQHEKIKSQNQNNRCQVWRSTSFVTVNYKPLYSPVLSALAKSLWVFGHAHPPGWVFYFTEISKHFKEGERSLYRAFNELVAGGLAARFPYKMQFPDTNKWVFAGSHYVFFQEYMKPEQIQEVKEEFKKSFPLAKFPHPQNEDAQIGRLVLDEGIVEDNLKDNAPSDDVAPVLPLSLATKKIEVANPANHAGHESFTAKYGFLVGLTLDQHNAIVARYGRETAIKAYEHLASWKISKAETDAKAIMKHTDYYRLTKWVIKEIVENSTSSPGTYKRTGKLAISADTRAMEEMKANPRKTQTEEEVNEEALARMAKRRNISVEEMRKEIYGNEAVKP